MADTAIEWTDKVWNPIAGCSVLTPGCTNCYAMKMAARLEAMGQPTYAGLTRSTKAGPVWTGTVRAAPEATLLKPLYWKKPKRIFVNSMSDLFHDGVADETIDRVFAVMALAPQHTFMVLTKRSARMRQYLSKCKDSIVEHLRAAEPAPSRETFDRAWRGWPLPNVWLGVSVEDHARADERIPDLLATPAAVRFISAEPLLGPVDLTRLVQTGPTREDGEREGFDALLGEYKIWGGGIGDAEDGWMARTLPRLDWVIAGGESGPDARPMHPDWARSLRDQCAAASVPFFFKQWGEYSPAELVEAGADGEPWRKSPDGTRTWSLGEWGKPREQLPAVSSRRVGKKAAGDLLDGVRHHAWPEIRR